MYVLIFEGHGYHEDPSGVMRCPIGRIDGKDELPTVFNGPVKPRSSPPAQNDGEDIKGIEIRIFQGNRWESDIHSGQLGRWKFPFNPSRSGLEGFFRNGEGLLRNPLDILNQLNHLPEGFERLQIPHEGNYHVLWDVLLSVVIQELFPGDRDEDIFIANDRVTDGMSLVCGLHKDIPQLSRDAVFSQFKFLLNHRLFPSVLAFDQLAVRHIAD